ncbi:MAG TPA: hypothetical protein VE575_11755 [Acidimicrobiales bacterium]|nr:hypothetical protein [Acidimicrobiales bacterium]
MAAEMPARVAAVDGAVVVDFPWTAAASAVAALNAASSTLGSQLDARAGMLGTLEDWEGTYRREFNGTHGRLTSTASGLKESLATLASSIVTGAENANQQQRVNNTLAEEREAEPAAS